MKKLFIFVALFFAAPVPSFASNAFSDNCSYRLGMVGSRACRGVKTAEEADLVVWCVGRVGILAAGACQGVKTSEDVSNVAACVFRYGILRASRCEP